MAWRITCRETPDWPRKMGSVDYEVMLEMNQPAEAGTVAQTNDEPPIQGEQDRQREELRMLVIGFGTGLSIAGIFLIYVVLDIAKLL